MTQLALFDDQATGPNGLRYVSEFISPEMEQELIARIARLPLKPFQFGAFEGHRQVKSFGFRYDYTLQKLTESDPIPDWLQAVARDVEHFDRLPAGSIRQVLCTDYDVGVG
ncbi:MAG: alpha-ketoglutarate-dependent dioxygenase AlkB, partial [Bradyrhizobium sp.]|nr:alpha-ketoglutarate-dependent dioxygenase AlkB [Bradyrhizobium sp.]